MKYRVLKLYFIIFFCLSSILFFSPIFIPEPLLYYIYYAIFLVTFLIVIISYRRSYNNIFSTPIFLLLTAILISGFSATFSWGQGLINSFKVLTLYLSYILFFLLLIWETHTKDIEKIIITLGVLYILVYVITFLSYPTPVFGNIESVSTDRGFERFRLSGKGFLFLFSFYSLGQLLVKKKIWWLSIYFITMVAIIMTLARSLIIASFFISVLFILRKTSFFNKFIASVFISCFLYLITQMNFFQLLVEQTKGETENVEDNIRVLSASYYLKDFSPDIFTRIFGNGEPSLGSSYMRYNFYLETELGFYQSDVGYIGLYSKFGLMAIIAYLILIYRTFKLSIPDEYLYCKYFLYFIFLISIIISAPFSASFIPSICFASYILSLKDKSKLNLTDTF